MTRRICVVQATLFILSHDNCEDLRARRNVSAVPDKDGQSKFIQLMYNTLLPSLYSLVGTYFAGLPQLYHSDDVKVYLPVRVDRLRETVKLSSSIGRSDCQQTAEDITYDIKILHTT